MRPESSRMRSRHRLTGNQSARSGPLRVGFKWERWWREEPEMGRGGVGGKMSRKAKCDRFVESAVVKME